MTVVLEDIVQTAVEEGSNVSICGRLVAGSLEISVFAVVELVDGTAISGQFVLSPCQKEVLNFPPTLLLSSYTTNGLSQGALAPPEFDAQYFYTRYVATRFCVLLGVDYIPSRSIITFGNDSFESNVSCASIHIIDDAVAVEGTEDFSATLSPGQDQPVVIQSAPSIITIQIAEDPTDSECLHAGDGVLAPPSCKLYIEMFPVCIVTKGIPKALWMCTD